MEVVLIFRLFFLTFGACFHICTLQQASFIDHLYDLYGLIMDPEEYKKLLVEQHESSRAVSLPRQMFPTLSNVIDFRNEIDVVAAEEAAASKVVLNIDLNSPDPYDIYIDPYDV